MPHDSGAFAGDPEPRIPLLAVFFDALVARGGAGRELEVHDVRSLGQSGGDHSSVEGGSMAGKMAISFVWRAAGP